MNILDKIKNKFFVLEKEQHLLSYFKKKDNNYKNDRNTDLVLVQGVEDSIFVLFFGTVIDVLKKRHSIKTEFYVSKSLYPGAFSGIRSFLISIFIDNFISDMKWIKLYSSFCDKMAFKFQGSTSFIVDIKLFFKAITFFKGIKTKKDLVDLKIDNVYVGDLIYDSYIRFKPSDTVDINDIYLLIVIWQALRNIYLSKQYFKMKKPKLVINTYSTYIQHGISARVALSYNIKVLTFGNNYSIGKFLTLDSMYQVKCHNSYKNDFLLLSDKDEKLRQAQSLLNQRLNGFVDNATSYMKSSAYIEIIKDIPDLKDKVVIFLHHFQDAIHVYSMIFNDYLEWVEFTIRVLEENNIQYCIKPHPNKEKENKKSIAYLKSKYNAMVLSEKITNKQLVEAGIAIGISAHGTVIHELAYQGLPVIACGDNPHSSYNFYYEAKTKEEYESLIKNYKTLKIPKNYKEEIESFYYMQNLNYSDNELEAINKINLLLWRSKLSDENVMGLIRDIKHNKSFIEFINEGMKK